MILSRATRIIGPRRNVWFAKNKYMAASKLVTGTTTSRSVDTRFGGHSGCSETVQAVAAAAIALLATTGLSWTFCRQDFSVKREYELVQLLGEGAYGKVFSAKRKSDGATVALKVIDRRFTDKDEFQREVNALRLLSENGGHPHVCQLYNLHDDGRQFYLVLELIEGGELFEHLIRNGPYSEAKAAVFLRQFAEAMSFMHSKGVTHGDLKPENLMMSSEQDDEAELKIVDFGCAVMRSESGKTAIQKNAMGTTAYRPPEMFDEGAKPTAAADMWATGCILYVLVCGSHPFDRFCDASDDEVATNIQKAMEGLYDAFDERVLGLSQSCVDLMKRLLESDPTKRMTSEEFRRHPWVQGLSASWNTMTDSDRKLEDYWQRRFRADVLKKYSVAIKGACLSEENLREIFHSMDLDDNGTLEPVEITVALRGLGVSEEDIPQLVHSIDLDGDGNVDWEEFYTVMRKRFEDGVGVKIRHRQQKFRKKILQKFDHTSTAAPSEEQLKEMFRTIDVDGNGVLDPHEIRVVLRSVGVDEHDISSIVASIDLDRSGGVDWAEFCEIMGRKFAGKETVASG